MTNISGTGTNGFAVYSLANDTLTKLANAASMNSDINQFDAAWSSEGQFLIISSSTGILPYQTSSSIPASGVVVSIGASM